MHYQGMQDVAVQMSNADILDRLTNLLAKNSFVPMAETWLVWELMQRMTHLEAQKAAMVEDAEKYRDLASS